MAQTQEILPGPHFGNRYNNANLDSAVTSNIHHLTQAASTKAQLIVSTINVNSAIKSSLSLLALYDAAREGANLSKASL